MTNYEFIKNLEGTRLGAVLSHIIGRLGLTKEDIIVRLVSFLQCNECKLHEKEECACLGFTDGCRKTLTKWLDSPVDDIIVLSKLPKEFSYPPKTEYEDGWNDCISHMETMMLSSDEENIE